MQSATASSSINAAQNLTTQLYIINAPEFTKKIQNYIQNAKKKNSKSILIQKNPLWYKIQTVSILNRRCSAPFNQKTCNPRAQETGRPLCWPVLCYSQDRTLSLRIRHPFKSSSTSCLLCLPAEAITSITGSAMAFGHQHSTTTWTEDNSQKENQKVQKIRRNWKIRIL